MIRYAKITYSLFILLIIAVIGYTAYTARNFIHGPSVTITTPALHQNTYTTTHHILTLSGTVHNATDMSINNLPILFDASGNFTHKILLLSGLNTLIFDVKDRFNRHAKRTVTILYTPKTQNVLQWITYQDKQKEHGKETDNDE